MPTTPNPSSTEPEVVVGDGIGVVLSTEEGRAQLKEYLDNCQLRKTLDSLGYQRVFNAIFEAVELRWGGTAIGISVETFIATLTGVLRDPE